MDKLPQIKEIINKHRDVLRDKYKVSSISLFGSYVRNEQMPGSDLDILVEFSETIDLFEFVQLEDYFSQLLDCKVDLIMKNSLKSQIKHAILSEAIEV